MKLILDETTGVNMAPVYLLETESGDDVARTKNKEHAQAIMSAVNERDTLLAQRDALREALKDIAHHCTALEHVANPTQIYYVQTVARAALALCEKGDK